MKKNVLKPIVARRSTLLLALLAAAFTACRTAELAVSDEIKTGATAYAVKGRQGFQVGQVLSFGEYKTSQVKRGWTFSYSIPFAARFSGAREKLSFQQLGPGGRSAEVAFVSRFKETELSPLKDYFSLSAYYQNAFAGGIELNGTNEGWEFIVQNVDGGGNSLKNNTLGFVRSSTDRTRIDIIGLRELEGSPKLMTMTNVYGYEFRLDGQTIGAVSTVNNGKVWIKDNLHPELKLVLASVASGLILRTNVEEEALAAR
ncbi:hypothetical protein GCM10027275_55380 [Rhabdobacter roseus]|uniref:Lipoprotein n=1 Tax=Rhabdobacter roseus TaxID=1655419 RepID=A0A840TUD4_9BACT|nr:hypothetical protein [Rhabdobacter roseus]MBB5287561.1 hypothetical protein [Rhabdobacter roseus]